MIAEFGHLSLALATTVGLFLAVVPLAGALRHNDGLMRTAEPAASLLFLLVGLAFLALTNGYLTSDFSILNVAQNSHSAKPLLYKISGVWGNHEGSMLLWVLVLVIFTMAVAAFGGGLPRRFRALVLAVQGMVASGFLLFILLTSNPFLRLMRPPLEGQGLNPILQDPGLALHPPFLYLGYVGFSVTFAFALAALLEGRVAAAWARWVRPWALAAWSFLTAGIVLGSWWAYNELGWGGWWFWDPVENASFIPWLTGTALVHAALVVEKRGTLKSWAVFLAIVTFALSLLGTFLVRSGVLTSVHAFASDPSRGIFILILLCLTVGGSFTLFALRAGVLRSEAFYAPLSREGVIVIGNAILAAAAGTVLVGTLYPLFVDVLELGKISVGAPFFNATAAPILIAATTVMGLGPLIAWSRQKARKLLRRGALAVGLACGVGVASIISGHGVGVAGGAALSTWILVATVADLAARIRLGAIPLVRSLSRLFHLPRTVWGMVLAHAGVGIIVAGITGLTAFEAEEIRALQVGERMVIADYGLTLSDTNTVRGPNYTAQRGSVTVHQNGKVIALLHSEKRAYDGGGRPTTEAGIHRAGVADLYVVVAEAEEGGGWVVRAYVKPGISLLWLGGLMLVLGGGLAASERRLHREKSASLKTAAARALLLVGLLGAGLAGISSPAGAVLPDERLANPVLETRARDISKNLRCLVCQNQSIDDSNADLARDLRILVRERLVAGDSDDEVIAYIVDRYGDYVLLTPPVNGVTAALWATPAVLMSIALLVVVRVLRRRKGGTEQ